MCHIYSTCKWHTSYVIVYVQNDILELGCAKDSNIGHAVTHHIKKIYLMWDKYIVKIIKPEREMLKIGV